MTIAKRNKRGLLLALSALVLACSVIPATAGEDIVVKQAWSRATPKGAQVAAGYLTIENHGVTADRLISAASPAAAKVEIHEMTALDGIMIMRPVEDGLIIAPGASATFAPGGNHLMFVGLNSPFREGDHVAAALMFEKAGKIDVSFDVGGIGAKGPRLIIASAEPVAPVAATIQPSSNDFFTHICGTRVMANVTVSPRREGPVDIAIELEDANEQPLAAEGLSATLSAPGSEIAQVTARAERMSDDKWHVRMPTLAAGKWSLALGIVISGTDRIDIAAPVLIER
jgi:periplasmic copper chaperone A